jgi:hypothetical protein
MMAIVKARLIAALMGCALIVPTFAQTVDATGPTAGSTAKTLKRVTTNGDNSTAGAETRKPDSTQLRADNQPPAKGKAIIVPQPTPTGAGNVAPLNGDESGVAPRADVADATGPDSQAIRSADSTAHQTVLDPDDQLGTSTQGKTHPGAPSDQSGQLQPNR